MRKKSKKKQIVAMALALSVFASTFGTLGAAAEDAGALPVDAEKSPFTVVAVALDGSENQSPTPPQSVINDTSEGTEETKDKVLDEDQDKDQDENQDKDQDKALNETKDEVLDETESKDENQGTEAPGETEGTDETDGSDGEGQEPSISDIQRPEQSETVETLPGNQEDLKKEPAEDDKYPESKDYEFVFDPETKHFHVTFHIQEDAEGDQTIELSKVLEEVDGYGQAEFDNWKNTPGYQAALNRGQTKIRWTGDRFNDVEYVFDLETGKASLYMEPGCTTIFDVSLANGSKHTYVYKDSSLTVATPDVSNTDKTGVTGFDGQELPEDYSQSFLSPSYSTDPKVNGAVETIIDAALKESESRWQYGIDKDGNLTTSHSKKLTSKDIPVGTPVYKIGSKYYLYSEQNDCYYCEFNKGQVKEEPANSGNYVVKSVPSSGKDNYAIKADGKKYYAPYVRGSEIDATKPSDSKIQSELTKYLNNNNTTLDVEILKYYNDKDGTNYGTLSELLAANPEVEKELTESSSTHKLNPVQVKSSQLYDNFYQNVLSFKIGDPEKVDAEASGNVDHSHSHGQWATDGTQETIGDYMAGKLTETGKWAEANSYFNTLVLSGMTEEEATWAAFTMATNIDGPRADNNYQNTAWDWYASMVLKQADGTLDLTKYDQDGNPLGESGKPEDQTSFYLWKYETDKETGEKDTMYCTYVEPTYTTNADGEQVLEKDGFYCWVKYDPSKDKLTYTVTTTKGKLNIDYALLENVVYYLQEAIAPDGYDTDPEIYIICDEESYKELEGTEVTNPATGATSKVTESSWLGSILGGKTLPINFMNTATVVPDPDPEPTPDPDPVPPVDPDIPVDPANPDNPSVQDADPDETPVTPENPQNPAVQDAAPDAAALPQTGTTSWMAGVLASLGSLLLACGWFFTRKQVSPKH